MKKHPVFIILLGGIIVIITFPLIFQITTHIPGFFFSDEPQGALWGSWLIKYSFARNLSLSYTSLIAYPFGVDLYGAVYISYLRLAWVFLLSILTAPVFTYNIQVLINFFLTGLFTYFLGCRLTKSRVAAFFGAIIFTFCPYQFSRAWQYLGLTFNQWIPLCLLAAVVFRENPSHKNFFFLSAAIFFLLSFEYTIMFLAGIALLSWFFYVFASWLRRRNSFAGMAGVNRDPVYLKKAFFAGMLALGVLSSKEPASAYNPYRRSFDDLFEQSARPLSYFLPPGDAPVFGEICRRASRFR